MKQKPIKGIEKHSNQWIALNADKSKIVASGKNLKDVYRQVNGKKVSYMRVPPLDVTFSP